MIETIPIRATAMVRRVVLPAGSRSQAAFATTAIGAAMAPGQSQPFPASQPMPATSGTWHHNTGTMTRLTVSRSAVRSFFISHFQAVSRRYSRPAIAG